MAKTTIEWTDRTWNPIRGCCSRVELIESKLLEPLSWRKPCKIFANSMSDLFHEALSVADIARVFGVMRRAHWHTYQVLTTRAERMEKVMLEVLARVAASGNADPLPNVWLGVSVEDKTTADERIPLLLQTPAVVRFISSEPLLGEIYLNFLQPNREVEVDALRGTHGVPWDSRRGESFPTPHGGKNNRLDWVICGGESGPGARPMRPDWARSLRYHCASAKVPFFFKQMCDLRGHKIPWDAVPEDLRVREFPEVAR